MSIEHHDRLPLLAVSGTPYDLGVALGRFGAPAVHGHLTKTQDWAEVVAYRDDPRLLHMARQVETRFPTCFAELAGLADGLDLPFDMVFAWNCRGDLRAIAPDGCTTVQCPGPRRIIAHNEDGDPGFRNHCALVRVVPATGIAFTAFAYPGSLPGHTFAATDAGLVQAVNNIRALDTGNGIPRMVLTRALLDCANLDQAMALLRGTDRAGAFHLTLGHTGDPRLLSVEFCASICSVRVLETPGVHANHLIHDVTANIPQVVTDSSACRQTRGDALLSAAGPAPDPLAILRDTSGPGLPIHRADPRDPDNENTLATAVFTMEDGSLDWYVYDTADEPARFHFPATPAPAD